MTRVKKGVHALKRRRSVLKQTKGMRHGRSTKERQEKEALLHAGNYACAHRKDKKSHNRKLWNIKINAGARELGMSYSKFKILILLFNYSTIQDSEGIYYV